MRTDCGDLGKEEVFFLKEVWKGTYSYESGVEV